MGVPPTIVMTELESAHQPELIVVKFGKFLFFIFFYFFLIFGGRSPPWGPLVVPHTHPVNNWLVTTIKCKTKFAKKVFGSSRIRT